jgi:hypothetical protein
LRAPPDWRRVAGHGNGMEMRVRQGAGKECWFQAWQSALRAQFV